MDTVALRDSWGRSSPPATIPAVLLFRPVLARFPIQMSEQRDKAGGRLKADVSNLDELDNVVPSLNNRVVTTVASRCE
jgi:hypothetical protein